MESSPRYRVTGQTVEATTLAPVPGLRVEVWGRDFLCDDPIGRVTTDRDGGFDLAFDRSHFADLFAGRHPDLYFKVFDGDDLVLNTMDDMLWNVQKGDTNVTLAIKSRTSKTGAEPRLTEAIPAEHVKAMREMVAKVAGQDSERRTAMESRLVRLLSPAATLDTLISDAIDFMTGDIRSADRFLINLNRLFVQQAPVGSIPPPPPDGEARPMSGQGLPAFIPNPRGPGLPRVPCLFPPQLAPQLRLSIDTLVDRLGLNPSVGDLYAWGLEHLFERLRPLEAVHHATHAALDGEPHHRSYFEDMFWSVSEPPERQPMSRHLISLPSQGDTPYPSGPSPFHEDFPVPGPPVIDLCRLERWRRTEQAVLCFRALREGPRYSIDDIYNVTKEVSRRGCAGDVVEVRGNHLGDRGEITFGRQAATIIDWTDTVIRFRVPERTAAEEIGVCIDPGIESCVGLPHVCRLSEPDTDHSFEFVPAPRILTFEYLGPTVESTGDDSYRAEACVGHEIHAAGAHAEQATITDGTGTVLWDSGTGSPRRVDTRDGGSALAVVSRQDRQFTLAVSNLCGTEEETIAVNIFQRFHIEGPDRVRAGEEIELSIRTSCEAEEGGLRITVSSSAPSSVTPPSEDVLIPEGENRTRVPLSGSLPCADADVTFEAEGHDAATEEIYSYDIPRVTSVSPLSVDACTAFTLDVQGDCFDPTGPNNVELGSDDGTPVPGISPMVRDIRFSDPADRVTQATLEVGVGAISTPGDYRVRVRSHGLDSEWFEGVRVNPVAARIHDFRSSTTFVYPCVENPLTFEWEVDRTERIEIRGPTGVVVNTGGPACPRWTGSETVRLDAAGTVELRAFPAGGGAPTTETIRLTEIRVLEASAVTIFNNTASSDRWIPHDLTVWVGNLTTGVATNDGVLEPGEETTISLTDCNVYGIACVSHYWIEEHNRRRGTSFDPDSRSILAYNQFHKLTVYVLGRDRAGTLYYNVEPGEGVDLYGEPPPGEES